MIFIPVLNEWYFLFFFSINCRSIATALAARHFSIDEPADGQQYGRGLVDRYQRGAVNVGCGTAALVVGLVPGTHRGRGRRADGTAIFVVVRRRGSATGVLYDGGGCGCGSGGGGCGRGV